MTLIGNYLAAHFDIELPSDLDREGDAPAEPNTVNSTTPSAHKKTASGKKEVNPAGGSQIVGARPTVPSRSS